jgi:hypothetical protein
MNTGELATVDERRELGFNPGDATDAAPEAQKKNKPRRLNINLPESKFKELEDLAQQSSRTMTDIVRMALELVKVAVREEQHGRKLAVLDPEGTLLKEIILLGK